ncbi:ABC transporter permease [Luedemannella flava]|uniref:ABC transporter permease n=1 Tax=Luedemannella flava TaxID=349316 RepID=A0ABP4YSV9_9ACTN
MIRFGLRLTVAGGREAVSRLVIIASAVAVGVALLLSTVAGLNAVDSQNVRYAWFNTGFEDSQPASDNAPVWWQPSGDNFAGNSIVRFDVAGTGPTSPVPPGLDRLPGPGEFFASPAMHELLATTPHDQLGARYPGHEVGIIGDDALPSPESVVIVVGRTAADLEAAGAKQVRTIGVTDPATCSRCVIGNRTDAMTLILSVVAGALLFPVLIFIGTATRLTAARREQRFAAMRLVGATPRQISVIAAVESTAAAVAGTVVGFGLFFIIRVPMAAVPFTGMPFFPSDLTLSATNVLIVGLGVPLAAAVAARFALRRVRVSPLGVTRRVTPRPPRAWRLIPLVVGVAELTWFIGRRPPTSMQQVAAFLPGFLIIMVGLIIAGPWLTLVGARLLARRANRPATLIATRRLADNPQAAFRAVSGLVLALFVTSVAVGVITTIVAYRSPQAANEGGDAALIMWAEPDDRANPDVLAVPGVRSATLVREDPSVRETGPGMNLPGVVTCADLARTPGFGRCPDGAQTAQVWPELVGYGEAADPARVWPAARFTVAEAEKLPAMTLVVNTDGTTATIERARTVLERAYPDRVRPPWWDGDFDNDFTRALTGWQQLANVVILASLPIAGCSLAVSLAGGLSERRRPFSLLRLSGVPLRMLRRVVLLESAVPLLVVALVAIGFGFGAAQLFLRAQLDYTLVAPGMGYYVTVVAGLAASLAIIMSTMPMLRRVTGPESARND